MALLAKKRPMTLAEARKRPAHRTAVRLLDPHALREEKGIKYHINHLRVLWQRGEFPVPISLSPRRIAWFEDDIDAWIVAKAEESAA
jgi:hypothetical protein